MIFFNTTGNELGGPESKTTVTVESTDIVFKTAPRCLKSIQQKPIFFGEITTHKA
uniref:Uncharacterized protein n=1 Tax=Anguilla anguilla TaxID=7936 RepID=A0A0E9W0X6_ANGAN